MRKRAGLARSLALDPEILFLDEPTAGLDPIAAADFDQLIRDLKASLGLTVFLVTHDLDTLFAICDRVAVLVDTQIRIGTLAEHLEDDHPWIRAYFHGPRGRAAQPAPKAAIEPPWAVGERDGNTGTLCCRRRLRADDDRPRLCRRDVAGAGPADDARRVLRHLFQGAGDRLEEQRAGEYSGVPVGKVVDIKIVSFQKKFIEDDDTDTTATGEVPASMIRVTAEIDGNVEIKQDVRASVETTSSAGFRTS